MSVVSGIMGANAQENAAEEAAKASREAAETSSDTQRYMFDKYIEYQQPFMQAGVSALPALQKAAGVPTATGERSTTEIQEPLPNQYMNQLSAMPSLALPETPGQFSYNLDPNDPAYKFKLEEAQKSIDAFSASRGNYNSRAAMNESTKAQRAITADEVQSQFDRAKDSYAMNLAGYETDAAKASSLYSTQYGKLTDLYNMASQIGTTDYNKLLDLVKIGQGSSSSSGAGALATGQGLAGTYGQLGANLSSSALASGQATSNMWGGIGGTNASLAMIAAMSKGKK